MFPWHLCAYHRCLIQSNLTWFGITNNMYPGLLAQQEQLYDTWIQNGVMLGNVSHDAWAETLPWTWVHLVACLMTEILLEKLALQSHLMQEMQWTAWMQCRSIRTFWERAARTLTLTEIPLKNLGSNMVNCVCRVSSDSVLLSTK